ncbi:hypothetical protein M404DRAFT_996532 [Pisolithus tinctorius Marx 270]|uniref:Uncharacterized protein n=1 Tax=Pisolithus tinctorius Marx 270 TaxID=870435 RepID=A0A0C3P895_PISTI|nr:hypothetical protein M404DRAFT_996532 [Pisolithus tinctorius Marx 270]
MNTAHLPCLLISVTEASRAKADVDVATAPGIERYLEAYHRRHILAGRTRTPSDGRNDVVGKGWIMP